MSKEAWFREFERLEAENEDLDDETLCDMADEAVADRMAQAVDQARDEAKYEGAS